MEPWSQAVDAPFHTGEQSKAPSLHCAKIPASLARAS